MEYEDVEICLFGSAKLLGLFLDVLGQFLHSILQRGPGVIDLVDNEDVLANQIGVLQRGEIEPLSPGNFCARFLFRAFF